MALGNLTANGIDDRPTSGYRRVGGVLASDAYHGRIYTEYSLLPIQEQCIVPDPTRSHQKCHLAAATSPHGPFHVELCAQL